MPSGAGPGKAFPNASGRENTALKLLEGYGDKVSEELQGMPVEVGIPRRMMLKRIMVKHRRHAPGSLRPHPDLHVTRDTLGEDIY
ncbi:MAG: lysine--tRNA ligase, partial [Dechloromonas sp.]|nr:lysine--tRNA ligase [Candidatus Dechloromonas phosphorivorans]